MSKTTYVPFWGELPPDGKIPWGYRGLYRNYKRFILRNYEPIPATRWYVKKKNKHA